MKMAEARASSTTDVEMAQARAEDARRRFERGKTLRADGLITAEEYDAVRTQNEIETLALAKAREQARIAALELERARALVQQSKIRSPFRGVIMERHLNVGEYLSRSGRSEAFTVVQLDPLHVEAFVPADMRESFRVGEEALVELAAGVERLHSASITAVDPVVDTASGTFRVRLELPNEEHRLPAGLRCQVILPF